MGSEKDPLIPKDVALTDSGRPVVKRSVHWALLSFLILGEIAGQGVFALPLHLGRLGWFAGTLTCFGTLAINNISLRIMYATHTRFPEAKSQGEAAGILFGPVGQGFIRAVVHLYLFTIGTRKAARGKGLGKTILRPMLDAADRAGLPCYLENSNPANSGFYMSHGFERMKLFEVGEGSPQMEAMWRDPLVQ